MLVTNGKKIFKLCQTDAVYVSTETLMRYITGFEAENGFIIVDKDGTTLFTDKRYIEAAEKLFQGTDVTPVLFKQNEAIERLAKYKMVGISFRSTTLSEFEMLKKCGAEFKNVDSALTQAIIVKNEWEMENIQKACEIAEKAFIATLPHIKEGMTETQVAAMLEYNMRSLGAEGTSFATICAFGAHAAIPHHVTGETPLKFGDEILLDFGCKVNGYCSDITRTVLFGDDGKHEEFKKAYDAVLTAHNLVQENLRAGMTGVEADAIARNYLKEKGYGELFTHSLGHGIGLNVHEMPSVSPKGESALLDGMVFSDEPGVYVAGEYGIRIEDTVTLENGRVKSFMSLTDKKLVIL
ncbi:MAG: aminopeptidase P family protein [Clostridia bacterium]|nr:aminopeptidase P family protein [Clostridia bacterium]